MATSKMQLGKERRAGTKGEAVGVLEGKGGTRQKIIVEKLMFVLSDYLPLPLHQGGWTRIGHVMNIMQGIADVEKV
eukprot:757377-Hanusia_phi.AAC.6